MLSLAFIFFASFFSSVSERLNGISFYTSIFIKYDPKFWNRNVSSRFVTRAFGYPCDAWLISKIAMVISMCMAVVCYSPITVAPVDFIIYVGTWAFNFDIFFTLIWKEKK